MRAELEQIIAQVRLMKRGGATHLFVEDATLEKLRTHTRAAPVAAAPSSAPAATTPIFTPAPPAPKKTATPAAPAKDDTIPEPPVVTLPEGDKPTRMAWLRDRVLNCPVCNAHVRNGRKVVFGVGSVDADIFFCGEAPGMEESMQGEPFVGPAGQLLTKMIEAMGLTRAQVYIGNIMNWRPQMPTEVGNREPTPQEMAYCLPYLKAQLEVVRPKAIVALGRTAVNALLAPPEPLAMGKARGRWFDFEGIPLMPTYHPSYLLRNQTLGSRRQVWEDLLCVMERVNLPVSDKQRGYFLKK